MSEPTLSASKARFSLSVKLSLGLILIIGMLFASVNLFNIYNHRKTRRVEALQNTATVARLVAGAMLGELSESSIESESMRVVVLNFLNAALTLNRKNKDLAYVVITGADGKLVVGRAKPKLVKLPKGQKVKLVKLTNGKKVPDEKALMVAIAKLKGKLGGHMRSKRFPLKMGSELVGTVIVGTSLARLEAEVKRDLALNIAVLIGALLLMALYSAITLGRMVIRPLSTVADAMNAVQRGDLSIDLDIRTRDEIGILARTYNFMVLGLRERERLKDAFNRYVSKQVYEKFQAGEIELSGETRQATILFSDIRSFTSLSEQLTPEQVVAMLNEYFTEMVEIVFRYDGLVNKFIGDAIMAIYNVPLAQDQPELRAVRTAVEMVDALALLNQKRAARGEFPIKIGIGVNTGSVVAGNIGHEQRLEYTVIGDAVNLAQRIESQTKVAGAAVLISEATYAVVKDYVVAESLPPVKVKGKAEAVPLYAVRALRDTAPVPKRIT